MSDVTVRLNDSQMHIFLGVPRQSVSHDLVRYNGSENCSSTTRLLCSPSNLLLSLFFFYFFFFSLVSLSPLVVIYGRAASPKVFHSVRWRVPRTPSALVKKRKDKRRPTIGDGKMEEAARMSFMLVEMAIIEIREALRILERCIKNRR